MAERHYRHTEKGREIQRKYKAAYRATQKGREIEIAIQTRSNHSPKGKERQARYWRSQKGQATSAQKYARRQGAIAQGLPVTAEDWQEILRIHKYHCHYCHKKRILTIDHVIPLSKGGKHVKENIVPACGYCNSAKGNKILRLL